MEKKETKSKVKEVKTKKTETKKEEVVDNTPITVEKNKGYVVGIIGSIIGGFVASIPWIASYVYMSMILSVLSLVIGFGAYYGYKWFGGKMDKKVPWIIAIVTVACVIISTVVIIPLLLLGEQGLPMSFSNLSLLYSFSEFTSAIMRDLIISIAFAILGISGLFKKLKNELS